MHVLEQLLDDDRDTSSTRYNFLTNEEANWIAQTIRDDVYEKYTPWNPPKHTS